MCEWFCFFTVRYLNTTCASLPLFHGILLFTIPFQGASDSSGLTLHPHIYREKQGQPEYDSVQTLKNGEEKKNTDPFTKVSDVPPDFTAVKFFASLMRTSKMPPDGTWESPFFPFLKLFFPIHRQSCNIIIINYTYTARLIWKCEWTLFDFFFNCLLQWD